MTTYEYLAFTITLNSNRFLPSMTRLEKFHFARFIDEVFNDRITEYFVYREWRNGGGKNYIARKDDDPQIRAKSDDIHFLQSSINYESGPKTQKLHTHVHIRISAKKYKDRTIDFWHNRLRLEYQLRFGQKCHLNIRRSKDETLGMLIYNLKKQDQLEGLDGVTEKVVVFQPKSS